MSKSRTQLVSGFAGLLTIICMASPAYALNPNEVPSLNSATGGTWNSSTATFNQSSHGAVANWKSFNIGSNKTVTFNQPSNGVALNRISGSASEIYGTLKANATVILVNQAGINFANGSKVNVGNLIATTSQISDSDFADGVHTGYYKFKKGGNAAAQIVNGGTITAADGGLVALVAPTVKNSGVISAKAGKIQMGSGDAYTVDLYGDGLLNLQASDDIKKQLVENTGTISANGGEVLMTAAAAKNVVDSLINMDGLIEANSIGSHEGRVTLDARDGDVDMSGTINAKGDSYGEDGGDVTIKASSDILMHDHAQIDVTSKSDNDGGDVSVRGGSVTIASRSSINTNGGEIEIKGTNPDSKAKNGITLDNALVMAGNGKITIEGEGTERATTDGNHGVKISGGTVLKATGAGSISIKGTGGNGGYTDFNTGVFVTGNNTKISTERGSLTITGFGGGEDWSGYAHGIMVNDNALVTSDSGKVSLTGIAGGGCNCTTNDWGVAVLNAKVTTNSGDIAIFGKGGGKGIAGSIDNYGVLVSDKAEITSARGDIDITGIGGGDQSVAKRNYGIYVKGQSIIGTRAGAPLDTGHIRFVADTLEMDNSVKIATTDTVFFEPYTDSTTIGVAGGAGTLQVDDIVLDDIKNAGHITIGNTTRDTGVMTANSYDWRADVSLLNKDGDINIDGKQDADRHTFLAWTKNGDITIGKFGSVSSDAKGTPIVLAASNGVFTNNSFKRGEALDVDHGARWLVFSGGPLTDTYRGLDADFHRYSCTYGGTCVPTIPSSGNGFIYSVTPVLTVAANNEHITYGDPAPAYSIKSASETYTFKGTTYNLIGTAFSDIGDVSLTSPYTQGSNKGSYPINPTDTKAATVGYKFKPIAGTLTVDAALLYVTANNQFMFMGGTVPPLTYQYSGFVNGDTNALFAGGLALGAQNGSFTYPIEQGTLSAGSNYTIVYTPGVLTVASPDPHNILERWKGLGKRGPNGVLLAIVNTNEAPMGNLADLAPAAGGDNPQRLAELAPKAGGNTGITPLVQCDQNTPCDINQ